MLPHYQSYISESAARDLNRIYKYVYSKSPAGAKSVRDSILDQILKLEDTPHRYIMKRNRVGAEVRTAPIGRYVIYFAVEEDGRRVRIIRVRHGSRQRPRYLE